jgi:hypothetical protein
MTGLQDDATIALTLKKPGKLRMPVFGTNLVSPWFKRLDRLLLSVLRSLYRSWQGRYPQVMARQEYTHSGRSYHPGYTIHLTPFS